MDEAAFRALISGERRGAGSSLLRGALAGASAFYRAAVGVRGIAYDRGWARATRVGVPVVSVGNVTAGGTGKTPFVARLVQWFQARGMRPAILSRGYRSLDGEANDEKLVLDRLCPGVPHVQNPDRIAGAQRAIEEFGAGAIVLDDGFQHRRLARSLDIVLIDALNPWGYGHLLPRGLLREPLSALRRAGLLVITRADQAGDAEKSALVETARRAGATAPVIEVAFTPESLVNAAGETQPLEVLRGRPLLAFCGIGNPAGFRRVLDGCGFSTAGWRTFPDHHHYTPADLALLAGEAAARGVTAAVTTEKDLVKLPDTGLASCPVWAVRIAARVTNGENVLDERLRATLAE